MNNQILIFSGKWRVGQEVIATGAVAASCASGAHPSAGPPESELLGLHAESIPPHQTCQPYCEKREVMQAAQSNKHVSA